MHHLDIAILNAFKKVEGKELTTSEIVRLIFPDDANTFDVDGADILFVGGEKKVRGKIRHKKSLLHKRLLYHLNKLVKNNILKLSGIEEFGEKRFALSGDSGEIILEDNTKTIVINNNLKPLTPIDGYEDKSLKQKELNKAFDQFRENNHEINLLAITPTKLPINKSFIYDL